MSRVPSRIDDSAGKLPMHDQVLAGRSVLLVENEVLIALDIRTSFENAGASVIEAMTLKRALEAIDTTTLDAAVLDYKLDDGDSTEICVHLEERNIPYVMHSGYPTIEGSCDDGVNLQKPASPKELVAIVQRLLN